MKKIIAGLAFFVIALSGLAESVIPPLPLEAVCDGSCGTISGRVQSLSMYRDYADNGLGNGANSTLGLVIGYLSPEFAGFDFGLTYNYAGEWFDNNHSELMVNDDINVLNEAWVRYSLQAIGLTNTTLTAGRKINNGEVFRADDFRQKARSIEAVQIETEDIPNWRLAIGHAIRMSSWIQAGDRADFNDFGDVFGADDDTDGITWGEIVYSGFQGSEIAVFDALAYDVAYLIGTRAKWSVTTNMALVGYYRHETDVGDAASFSADAFGLSLQQEVCGMTLEPGYFAVHGGDLRFQETTTGINHPLGSSMMIYSTQFAGGSDTLYLKATGSVGETKLYALYNYTWHNKLAYDGQEINFVVKQPICDKISVALKIGAGHRSVDGGKNTTATDARLFVTYNF